MELKDFLNDKGRVSSTRSTIKWVNKNFPDEYESIINNTHNIGLNPDTFAEQIYHYINNLDSPVLCKTCGIKKPRFNGLVNGYLEYCSAKCSNSSKLVKERKRISSLDKYGVDNPAKSNTIKAKIQKTFDEKYGGNPLKLPEFREIIEKTNIERYGEKSPMKRGSRLREDIDNKRIDSFIRKYKDFEIIRFDTIKNGDVVIKCQKCLGEFSISKWNLYQRTKFNGCFDICTICNPIGSKKDSALENFIESFLNDNNIIFQKNNRQMIDGKEIDFYIPERRIGIEINGLFWHSEKFKTNTYHLEKTNEAKNNGISLIHIFEDEIKYKPEIVKSRLMSILHLNKTKIFARKCEVRNISKKESSAFMNTNHIQGNSGCKISLGLFNENTLVSVMTFGDLRINLGSIRKEKNWELIRFCNLRGVSVVGGASKLFNEFIKMETPDSIISYCDRRWSNGEFYSKIGFIMESNTKPNYHYIKNGLRESRFKYRKDVLVKNGFSKDKSESEIMLERGYFRIYDCGSYKFVWNKKKLNL